MCDFVCLCAHVQTNARVFVCARYICESAAAAAAAAAAANPLPAAGRVSIEENTKAHWAAAAAAAEATSSCTQAQARSRTKTHGPAARCQRRCREGFSNAAKTWIAFAFSLSNTDTHIL